jgi:ribose 5-phosphate isomerase RpiB
MTGLSLAIGGDHAGFPLKGPIIEFLRTERNTPLTTADLTTRSPATGRRSSRLVARFIVDVSGA